jgi:hypothetical protein
VSELESAAQAVVDNSFGTTPKHTKNIRLGGCDPSCIPCGMEALKQAVGGYSWEKERATSLTESEQS